MFFGTSFWMVLNYLTILTARRLTSLLTNLTLLIIFVTLTILMTFFYSVLGL